MISISGEVTNFGAIRVSTRTTAVNSPNIPYRLKGTGMAFVKHEARSADGISQTCHFIGQAAVLKRLMAFRGMAVGVAVFGRFVVCFSRAAGYADGAFVNYHAILPIIALRNVFRTMTIGAKRIGSGPAGLPSRRPSLLQAGFYVTGESLIQEAGHTGSDSQQPTSQG